MMDTLSEIVDTSSRCNGMNQDTKNQTVSNDKQTSSFHHKIFCCDSQEGHVFYKGCKWSPDEVGNRILTCDEKNTLTMYHTFLNKLDYSLSQISKDKCELRNFGKIYDYGWYPAVTSSQYYAIMASSLGPLHIYDFVSKKSIASYQMYNRNDEMVHANSVACSEDGTTIIGGTADYIFLFDVNRPGRTYDRIFTRQYFKKGIISTIAVNPIRFSLFAVGSYNNRVGIYDGTDFLCTLYGHVKGITQVKFSPDGTSLLSGTRGNNDIICWDLRNPGTALYKLERVVRTQQRIYFDISPCNRYIVSGSTEGDVYIWDSKSPSSGNILLPIYKFRAYEDCCNGVSLHPQLPFLATVSGQYHYPEMVYTTDSDDEVSEIMNYESAVENKLKLWQIDLSAI